MASLRTVPALWRLGNRPFRHVADFAASSPAAGPTRPPDAAARRRFLDAAARGDFDEVRKLVDQDARYVHAGARGDEWTALHHFASKRHADALRCRTPSGIKDLGCRSRRRRGGRDVDPAPRKNHPAAGPRPNPDGGTAGTSSRKARTRRSRSAGRSPSTSCPTRTTTTWTTTRRRRTLARTRSRRSKTC